MRNDMMFLGETVLSSSMQARSVSSVIRSVMPLPPSSVPALSVRTYETAVKVTGLLPF